MLTVQDKDITICDDVDLVAHTNAANPHSGSAASGANSDITSLSGLTTALSITQGGTGQITAQAAIDALTQVSSATNEHVLTKDTGTGSAKWKAPSSGGADENILNLSYDTVLTTDFTHWDTSVTGSGEIVTGPHWLRVHSGSTANSEAKCYCTMYNTVYLQMPRALGFFDIDIYRGWVLGIEDQLANSITSLLYALNTGPNPTSYGFGFRIDDRDVKGVVHDGTSLTEVDLSTTLVVSTMYRLSIMFTAGSKIEWFINGVSKGESTSIPTGTTSSGANMTSSMYLTNGADGTSQAIDCYKAIFKQKLWE